jgi:hypothetical protein
MKIISTIAMLLLLSMASSFAGASITLTFSDNTTPKNPYPANINIPSTGVPFTQAFGVGKEFRFIGFDGSIIGGGEKDGTFGGGSETWSFDQNGNLTGTTGFPGNPGAATGSAAPTQNTNPLLLHPGFIAGQGFSFLAPASGSLAGAAYGNATGNFNFTGGLIDIVFPVMEAQWGGMWFPLGSADQDGQGGADGISLNGVISNVINAGNVTTFDFSLFGEHKIDASEDPFLAGLTDVTLQWELHGSGVQIVPIPPAFWLFGSGLMGLVGIARRKKA